VPAGLFFFRSEALTMRSCLAFALAAFTLAAPCFASAQSPGDRDRAVIRNRLGWDYMKAESWDRAAEAFQSAIDFDPTFEMPYYGLGRADMALKKYVAAIAAYVKCRELYQARAGQQFANAQDAQRYRTNRLTEIDELIRQLQSGPQTIQVQDQLRQIQEQRRQIQEVISRGNDMSMDSTVPAWVSLALGSAYFRAQRLADAEREYKATIDADSKSGEAHNNLAVVYMLTGRLDDSAKELSLAEKSGYKVNPEFKKDLNERRRK
jgi:tetratricopeptide (TPR) repeat protein